MSQKDIFREGEGDAWYKRNKRQIDDILNGRQTDKILDAMRTIGINPKSVLEVGCSNGYRLFMLNARYQCRCKGVDPSREAIAEGKLPQGSEVNIFTGTADDLCFGDKEFDTVIFGFCLYLCDREDLFKICMEADRVLKPGGRIIIYDFYSNTVYSNEYCHHEGVKSFKMDYKELFLSNPSYSLEYFKRYGDTSDEWTAVCILRKDGGA